MPLPEFFDCLRESNAVVLAAHRGGPAPGIPENAIETMQRALTNGVYVFEVDVAESRDGVLFLMHDRSLGRTTTLNGPAFGTLGRRGERLDDRWLADGDASEFSAVIDDGVVLLATDAALQLAELLDADDRARVACPR